MSKVDRRILKSQEAIKKAVIELMAEKSFDDITIQDISDRANVSRGTIYLHYLDKYDLLWINSLKSILTNYGESASRYLKPNIKKQICPGLNILKIIFYSFQRC